MLVLFFWREKRKNKFIFETRGMLFKTMVMQNHQAGGKQDIKKIASHFLHTLNPSLKHSF